MLALLDTEFDQILTRCADSLVQNGQCNVEPDEIEAFYDDTITRSMIAVHKTADAGTPTEQIADDEEVREIREFYTLLEGSSIVFNQLSIRADLTTASGFTLATSSDDLLEGRVLQLNWNPNYDQITYELNNTADIRQTDLFNYQNNANGQRLTVQRNHNPAESTPGNFLIELTANPSDSGEVFYNARVNDYFISGQADDETAYAYTRDTETEANEYYQEVFDEAGYLIAMLECIEEEEYPCEEIEPDDEFYEYYLSPDEFDEAIFGLGFHDIEIVGLPADIYEFLIVENDPEIPLWLRDQYCEGWQPIAGEIELFCFVDELDLDDAVVVSADGEALEVVPTARIVIDE